MLCLWFTSMARMCLFSMFAIYFGNVGPGVAEVQDTADPCLSENHEELPYMLGRSTNCPQNINSFCDNYLAPGWYRVNSSTAMPTECVETGQCGTSIPVWMNGTTPLLSDGIVDRNACIVFRNSCCHETLPIKVKHCTSFLVYNLPTAPYCPTKYCFGTDKICEEPTEPPITTEVSQDTADPCLPENHEELPYMHGRSTNCPQNINSFCDNYLAPGWYRVNSSTPMPTECVETGQCRTSIPVWMNGTTSLLSDGIVDRNACIVFINSCCHETLPIKVKHCTSFLVYHLPTAPYCLTKYCFDPGSQSDCQQRCTISNKAFAAIVVMLLLMNVVTGIVVYIFAKRRFNKVTDDTNIFPEDPGMVPGGFRKYNFVQF